MAPIVRFRKLVYLLEIFHEVSAAPVNNCEIHITISHSLCLFIRVGKGYMFSKGIGNIVAYVAYILDVVVGIQDKGDAPAILPFSSWLFVCMKGD